MTKRSERFEIPEGTPKEIIITKTGKKILIAGKITKNEKEKLKGKK